MRYCSFILTLCAGLVGAALALPGRAGAEPCRHLAAAAKAAGYPVDIKVYEGAHHSFDNASPVRFKAERRNFSAVGGHGATTGGNRQAWADAILRVREFLHRNLAPQVPR